MGILFYRPPLEIVFTENFEYSGNWSGTIQNINYPDTFTGFDTSPFTSFTENFESGW